MTQPPEEILQKIRRMQVVNAHLAEDIMAGLYRSAFKGQGMEFEEVREYQAGDEVRSIDWKVTARLQKPFVKTFREERSTTVMLLADISPSMDFGSTNTKKKTMAELASLIAFAAASNNDRVGLVLFDANVVKVLPPKKGRTQAMRCLRHLMLSQGQGSTTAIEKPLLEVLQHLNHRSVCFMLSDFLYGMPVELLLHVAHRHDLIAAAVRDRNEHKLPPIKGLLRLKDNESGFEQLYDGSAASDPPSAAVEELWQNNRLTLLRCGIPTFELWTHQAPLLALRRFLRLRLKRQQRR